MKTTSTMRACAAVAAAAFATVTGCGSKDGNEAASPRGDEATALTKSEVAFMRHAAEGGLLEIRLGATAVRNAASAEVKAYGERMVQDHQRANDELQRLAARKGVRLPTELSEKHAKMLNKLAALHGKEFDEAYTDDMIDDHVEDIREFEKAQSEARDPDLRGFATSTLPTLRLHFEMARDARAKSSD